MESRFGDAELRETYPLEIISAKSHDSMNSTFGNRARPSGKRPYCSCMSTTPRPRGIEVATACECFNQRGSCLLMAGVNGVVRPGVVLRAVGALEQVGAGPQQYQRPHL